MKTHISISKMIVLILGTVFIQSLGMQSVSHGNDPDIPQIYWLDASYDKIRRANLDGTNIKDIITGLNTRPIGIALDLVDRKMYWTQDADLRRQIPGSIWRANLDGTHIQNLITGLGFVRDIALDPVDKKIYWIDLIEPSGDRVTFKIQRSDLNGRNIQNIITEKEVVTNWPYIALDVEQRKIYWTHSGPIKRANFDGTHIQSVVTVPDGDTRLDIFSKKIYYSDGFEIRRMNLDGTNAQDVISVPVSTNLRVERGKMFWFSIEWDHESDNPMAEFWNANLDGTNKQKNFTLGPEWVSDFALSIPPDSPDLMVDSSPDVDVVLMPEAKLAESAVPTTGTWVFVNKPRNLTPDNFTIGPGEFAILVHQGEQNATKKANFKTYASYYAHDGNADLPNLAHFFQNGGRIELISHATLNPLPPDINTPEFGDIVISEIMWGLNGASPAKQYIELYNASAHTYTFWEGNLSLRFSKAPESPLPDRVFPFPPNPKAHTKVVDRVSNKGWKVPGRSGNTLEKKPLISMYRTIDYTTEHTPDGTLSSSWKASTGRVNLLAPNYGTPGARHLPPRPVVLVAASQRPPMYWVDVDARTLHHLVGDEVENLVPNVKNATSLAVDMVGGKLHWTEKTSNRTGRIRRANLDGTNVRLVKNLTSVPHSIALDAVNGKIYLTNASGKIQRLNFDGSNFQPNLITDLDTPGNLVLDVMGGKVYWTETTGTSGRIRRATLDGSRVQYVAADLTAPLSLAVANGKVYWTSARRLYHANPNGTNRRGLETLPIAPTSLAVDPARNSLYLTFPSGEIHQRDLDSSGTQPVVTGLVSPSNIVLGISATPPVSKDTTVPPSTPVVDATADVNQDKKVNKTDLLLVVTALGESPPANPNFDVNADGTVNIADVLLVIEALDDPVAAAAPSFGETLTALDPARLAMQIDILRAENDGSLKYAHAIAFFQSLLASIRPTETQLLANYPNPFNPETWIPYQLATDSDVKVTIYDGRGVVVRQLVLGHQVPGFYTSRSRAAYWDGRNALGERVASGIYFYQLQADGVSSLRKMLILK